MKQQYRRHLALLLLIAFVVLIAGLGLRDPWPSDEPRFALIARDMVESGNWFFPHIGGVLYPDKPPLFFWFVAVIFALSDSINISILLPGVVAGIGVLLLVTDLARRLWGPEAAIACGATLLAIIQFPLQMKSGQIDGFLCLWTTLGLYGFCRHLLLGPDWRWYAIGGLACGLGVITKGVGFLPFLVLIPYTFATRSGWPVAAISLLNWRWLLAPVAFLFAISLWLIPMLLLTTNSGDPALIDYRDNILLTQTITRYADSWGHVQPPWYLLTNAAPWLWFPVTALLPWLIPAWRRDIRDGSAAVLIIGAWIVLLLLFFSISAGKRSLYIFPGVPALALIAGYHVPELLRRAGPRKVLMISTAVLGFLLLTAATVLKMYPALVNHWVSDREIAGTIPLRMFGIAALVLIAFVTTRIRHAAIGFVAGLSVIWIGLSVYVYPPISDVRSGKAIIAMAEEHLDTDAFVAIADWPEQFLLQWKRPGPVVHFGYLRPNEAEARDAAAWLLGGGDRRVLLSERLVEPCFEMSRLDHVGLAHRRDRYLADQFAVSDACKDLLRPVNDVIVYRRHNL